MTNATKKLINTISGFTSKDLTKAMLTKISQRNNQLAATDGYKLIVVPDNSTPVELPEELKVGANMGTYPNYERILPKHFSHVQTFTVGQAKKVIKTLKTLTGFSKSLLKHEATAIAPNASTSVNNMVISFHGLKISIRITGKATVKLAQPKQVPFYSDRKTKRMKTIKQESHSIETTATAVNVDTGTIDKPTGLFLSPALNSNPADSFDYQCMTYNANYLIQCLEAVVNLSEDNATIYIRFDSEGQPLVIDNNGNDPTVTVMLMPVKP